MRNDAILSEQGESKRDTEREKSRGTEVDSECRIFEEVVWAGPSPAITGFENGDYGRGTANFILREGKKAKFFENSKFRRASKTPTTNLNKIPPAHASTSATCPAEKKTDDLSIT